jgi:hypothetical protein
MEQNLNFHGVQMLREEIFRQMCACRLFKILGPLRSLMALYVHKFITLFAIALRVIGGCEKLSLSLFIFIGVCCEREIVCCARK